MEKTVLKIDGMMCGMCESHINQVIYKQFDVKKVTSSHRKGTTEILSEKPLDQEALKQAIGQTGYSLQGISAEPYAAKKFSLFHRG
ncbi:heavy metal-associated domain-containing protein [Erysipelotrichaceae bacterium 51-3]